MNDSILRELKQQILQLRTHVVSLSATLLRKAAVESDTGQQLDEADAERLLHEAEDCFRCARIPGLNSEIAQGLQAAGRELMAKAVEIETERQRDERKK